MKKRLLTSILLTALSAGTIMMTGCGSSAADSTSTDTSTTDTQAESNSDTAASENDAAASGDDLLSQIKERGEIVVAMEGTWSPWTYHDEDDNLVGYDVEVAKAIADKLGVEVTFVEAEWDGLFAGLDSGRYDLVVNGVDWTEERAEKYDFSEGYAFNRAAVIVKNDNDEITSLEDLAGKTTANSLGSTYAEIGEAYGATVTVVDDLNQTFELLLSGRIDATINSELTYYDYMAQHPDEQIKIAAYGESNEVAIPMRKGDETASLREAVNAAIDELRLDGTLGALSEKYFGVDIASGDAIETAD